MTSRTQEALLQDPGHPLEPARARRLWALFAGVVALLALVSDGWSGKPSPVVHQLLLLFPCGLLACALVQLLWPARRGGSPLRPSECLPVWWLICLATFEAWSLLLFVLEAHHFRQFGYHLAAPWVLAAAAGGVAAWSFYLAKRSGLGLLVAVIVTFAGGMVVAIRCFPLNYLRSDMLPVIDWADGRLLQHLNPYTTMRVGSRVYDFPYLPGMLVAFAPAAFLHLDLRWATLFYLVAAVCLVFWAARKASQVQVSALLGVFVLCPFLQYRHDLYLEPHWFALVVAVVLMQRRSFFWAAVTWGVSCAIYQLSWVIVPFAALYAYRRGSVSELVRMILGAVSGFLIVVGPFLASATSRMTSNTVGQWSRLPHALADPINLSYWLTYLLRPDQLKWVQAAVLVGLFGWCCWKKRCATLADTLRWMCCALAFFIPLNVIVDGYFYLTLALMLLLFLCVENGWWREPQERLTAVELLSGARSPKMLTPL